MNNKAYLVVGGDSLVGAELYRVLRRQGKKVYASTRKKETLNNARIYLDFEKQASFNLPEDVDYIFVVAATTDYTRCENDPKAWTTNVELIPEFILSMLEKNVFVTFISTNSVFGGERPWPDEDDEHEPGIAYAKQKSEGEKNIIKLAKDKNLTDMLNITRLTKILSPDTSPLPNWFSSWKNNEIVEPFTDLIFAPMSLGFVAESLAKIGELHIPGNLHLSGKENVSYLDLANNLANLLKIDKKLIQPSSATEKGIDILFKPRFSGIGMEKTSNLTGIKPQSIDSVIEYLVEKSINK